MQVKLTVLFENPFWIGIFERKYNGNYDVSKVTFGAEPKDYEVYEFVLNNFYKLKFGKPTVHKDNTEVKINPKRLQRQIKKETLSKGIGTKAQQAIKEDIESRKTYQKAEWKMKREEKKKEQYELKKLKNKEKKKGH